MITPNEIQEQCSKWWKEVLISTVDGTNMFPREINRIGKISSKDILTKLSAYKHSIELLKSNSKENRKVGYSLVTEERHFDKIGKQIVPVKISIDCIEDYLAVTKNGRDYETFCANLSILNKELPALMNWVRTNPFKVFEHKTWDDTLKVCKYFIAVPKPKLYIRQLPIAVHTKYVQENRSIIQSLLEFLIPEHINEEETKFESRFNLKYAEPLIRIRFLDALLSPISTVTDLSLTISEFCNVTSDCTNIFVTENLMNFLTLPYLKGTIAIWSGGGFNVSYLTNIEWIKAKRFFYWGDLDAHGFQILNQFRAYFQDTVSVMMDKDTFSSFTPTNGPVSLKQNLPRLSESESKMYIYLQESNLRLEQERIAQDYVEKYLAALELQSNLLKPVQG